MNDVFSDDDFKNIEGLDDYMAIVYNRNPDNTLVVPEEETQVQEEIPTEETEEENPDMTEENYMPTFEEFKKIKI